MALAACTCTCRGGASRKTKNEFLRGYHIEFGGDAACPASVNSTGVCREYEGTAQLEAESRSSYGTVIGSPGAVK